MIGFFRALATVRREYGGFRAFRGYFPGSAWVQFCWLAGW